MFCRILVFLVFLPFFGCTTEDLDRFDCDAVTDMTLCNPKRCDIRRARYFEFSEEKNAVICDDAHNSFDVCVPKPAIVPSTHPDACYDRADFCFHDYFGREMVIEGVDASFSDGKSMQLITIPGWELCNCGGGNVDNKSSAHLRPNKNYFSLCEYCGDGILNGINDTERCEGNCFMEHLGPVCYTDPAPCPYPFVSGFITCTAGCWVDYSNCIESE